MKMLSATRIKLATLVAICAFIVPAVGVPQDKAKGDAPPAKVGAKTAPNRATGKAAEKARPYQPVGAPSDPKVDVRWNRFHDFTQASDILKNIAKTFPRIARLESLGKSYGKRDMWVITITNFKRGKPDRKPAFWIDGGIHANEIQSVEVSLYTAWYLCEMYGRSDYITRLVNERVFYIAPMLSPDSRDAHMTKPNTAHSPRTGQRPVDDDRDGQIDEDGPDDLNNDGHITTMRIKDRNGKWKPHAEFPQLLVRVKDGERGSYTVLGSEGYDNDGDGKINEDGDGYYDPNRDWAWNWQPGYVQRGAHRYPFSIKENRMIADFVMKHPNIAGAQSYHNTGGMILRGPGAKTDRYHPADVRVFDQIAKKGIDMLPGYRYLNVAHELYEVYGGEVDWFYGMRGVYCYTNELFTPFNYFRKASGQGFFGGNEERHRFNKMLLFQDGFVKWEEVDHPQYGKVEVGGFKKSWTRNPPSFLLEEECHRNMAFTLFHADQMPRVRVVAVSVKPMGNLMQVTAIIRNTRITPTRSSWDAQKKLTRPDHVTIKVAKGKKLQVVTGFVSSDSLFRRPTEQEKAPAVLKINQVPGNDVVYVRWLVRGSGPFVVAVDSVKGGRHQKASR